MTAKSPNLLNKSLYPKNIIQTSKSEEKPSENQIANKSISAQEETNPSGPSKPEKKLALKKRKFKDIEERKASVKKK